LLSLPRSGLYYQPVAVAEQELALMVLLDKQYLKTPFYGYRKMRVFLQAQGYCVNHKRVRRLMQLMDIEALYCRANRLARRSLISTATDIEALYCRANPFQPNKAHQIYPYLLKGLAITKANQVWATDITYVPMQKGFMYLIAIIDLYSRYVLEWSVSNTMESEWCTQVLRKAISKHGKPALFNTDQGSQFTAELFGSVLLANGIQPSMDGNGRAIDNIFVERLWPR